MGQYFCEIDPIPIDRYDIGQEYNYNMLCYLDTVIKVQKSFALQNRIKEIQCYEFKKGNYKDSTLYIFEKYDEFGNIDYRKERTLLRKNNQSFFETFFSYNIHHKLIEIKWDKTLKNTRHLFIQLGYNKDGRIDYISSNIFYRDSLQYDTYDLSYFPNGLIKIFKSKVLIDYYNYDKNWKLKNISGRLNDTIQQFYYDMNGCLTQYCTQESRVKYIYKNDSNCNLTDYKIYNRFITYSKDSIDFQIKFDHQIDNKFKIVKKSYFSRFKRFLCKSKMKLLDNLVVNYNYNGLPIIETDSDRKGNIISIKKYYYKFYD